MRVSRAASVDRSGFHAVFLLLPALALLLQLCLAETAFAGARSKESQGDGWPEIPASEKNLTTIDQDPEAPAIVLRKERKGKIVRRASEWVNVMNHFWRLKVLKEAGTEYAEIRIPANKFSRVSNVQARTIKPDGTIVPVPEDQIFEKEVRMPGGWKRRESVFNFPAVEPGVILEYRYERHSNYLLYIEPWYFEGPEFTLWSRVEQAIPSAAGYSILCDLCPPAQKPDVTKWREGKAKGKLYAMELRNLEGYRAELMMPPRREISPRMEMVLHTWYKTPYFTDWNSVAKYAGENFTDAIKSGRSDFEKVVAGWLKGTTDPQERLKSILRHVREDFRYIPYNYVIGNSRSIDSLLEDMAADNEEKAVLLKAALDAAEVESRIALVAGKHVGSLNPKFISLSQFSHAVVAVPQPDGSYKWLDPTVACAPFEFTPWANSGATALLMSGKTGELVTLPERNELNTTRFKVDATPRQDGRTDLKIAAAYRGEDAIEMRNDLLPLSESDRLSYLQQWVESKRPGTALTSHSIENLEEFEEPLTMSLSAESPGLVTLADGVIAVRGCALTCLEANPFSRRTRAHPFYVDRGWNVEERLTIRGPEEMKPAKPPARANASSSIGRLTFRCVQAGGTDFRCTRTFVAQRSRWSAGEFLRVRDMYDQIIEADQTRVAFHGE